jgi:hypothetical protein
MERAVPRDIDEKAPVFEPARVPYKVVPEIVLPVIVFEPAMTP